MSVSTGQFLNAIGLTQPVLERLAESADRFTLRLQKTLEDALPALQAIAERLERLERMPPVRGHEDYLVGRGQHRLMARILALNIRRLTVERIEERRAERNLSSAVYRIAKVKDATPLVISRRAPSLAVALEDDLAGTALDEARYSAHHAFDEAGISETNNSIKTLAERAALRDVAACKRLSNICALLKPYVEDPRGLFPSVDSVAHELFLHLINRAYTYDPFEGTITDQATQATRIATNNDGFDPHSAQRRVKKRKNKLAAIRNNLQ
jgi:hypothetical protein